MEINITMNKKAFYRSGFTVIEFLVVILISSIVLGLVLGAIHKSFSVAAKTKCSFQMKQLALALSSYHSLHSRLPSGQQSFSSENKYPFSGWLVHLLPLIEKETLFKEIDIDYQNQINPFSPTVHQSLSISIPDFVCPVDSRVFGPQISLRTKTKAAFSSYLGIAGTDTPLGDGVLFQNSAISFTEVLDGLGNTLLIGERPPSSDFQDGWWYAGTGLSGYGDGDMIMGVWETNRTLVTSGSACGPGRFSFQPSNFQNPCGVFHYWSPHPGGGSNFAFCDGSVRFLRYGNNILLPISTRSGGEINLEID